mgnify:CR=1 FL=1
MCNVKHYYSLSRGESREITKLYRNGMEYLDPVLHVSFDRYFRDCLDQYMQYMFHFGVDNTLNLNAFTNAHDDMEDMLSELESFGLIDDIEETRDELVSVVITHNDVRRILGRLGEQSSKRAIRHLLGGRIAFNSKFTSFTVDVPKEHRKRGHRNGFKVV